MQDLKVLFLGTSSFALPSLRVLAGHLRGLAVVTRPDRPAGRGKNLLATPVKNEAIKHDLRLFQPEGHADLLTVLEKADPHLLVNVAFGMFLNPDILNFPPLGCINLHPSLLPAYRGAAPIQRAIMSGEKTTGVTVLYMVSRLDAGDIILQEKTAIDPLESYGALHDRLAESGSLLLYKALKLVAKGEAPRFPQDENRATYAPIITREEEEIIWTEPAVSIHNLVRSLNPVPGAYTRYRKKRLKIWATSLAGSPEGDLQRDVSGFSPGTISAVGRDYLELTTGRGGLRIIELQPEGKKRMSIEDFLKGYRLEAGEKFE